MTEKVTETLFFLNCPTEISMILSVMNNKNLDKVIKKVLKDIEFGDEQVGEVLDNCEIDYGIDGLTVAREMLKRGFEDEEVLNDYISSVE